MRIREKYQKKDEPAKRGFPTQFFSDFGSIWGPRERPELHKNGKKTKPENKPKTGRQKNTKKLKKRR